MPVYLGEGVMLLTKQENKIIRDLNLTNQRAIITEIARQIQVSQTLAPEETLITLNRLYHDDVDAFFKNTMSYTVDSEKQGNQTLIRTISWA